MCHLMAGLPYNFFLDRYADSYVNVMNAFVKYVETGDESLEPALGMDGKITIFIGKSDGGLFRVAIVCRLAMKRSPISLSYLRP